MFGTGGINVTTSATGSGSRRAFHALHSSNNTIEIHQFGQSHSAAPAVNQIGVSNAEQHLHLVTDTSANIDAGSSTKGIMIRSGGNVGIGINDPLVKLDVRGSASAPATSGTAQTGSLRVSQTVGNGVLDMGFYTSSNGTAWLQSTNKTNLATNYDIALQPNGGNVGIAENSPLAKLEVAGSIKATNRDVSHTSEAGVTLAYNTSEAMAYIETWTSKPLTIRTYNSQYFNISGATKMQVHSTGITVTGTMSATGDVIAYSSSDARLKDNVTVIDSALAKVSQIRGVEFDWNENQTVYEGHDIGVIAQEVEAVAPEIVVTRDDGYKAVNYQKLTALLIEAVKELKEEIKELKKDK